MELSACTLPPELIERFVRVRAQYLEGDALDTSRQADFEKKFFAANGGVTREEFWDTADSDPARFEELKELLHKLSAEDCDKAADTAREVEITRLTKERWSVAEAMLSHEPKSIADLAWQAEAWLLADLEMIGTNNNDEYGSLLRTLFRHIRALGALPQPADPFGSLTI